MVNLNHLYFNLYCLTIYVCIHFTVDCFIHEDQYKEGFTLKLKLKDGSKLTNFLKFALLFILHVSLLNLVLACSMLMWLAFILGPHVGAMLEFVISRDSPEKLCEC